MESYIAFLRGINVGGKKIIKMDVLKRIFESSGYSDVRTYIQSGNVFFDSLKADTEQICIDVEKSLLNALGYEVEVLLYTFKEIENLVKLDPFKDIKHDEKSKLYISFLKVAPGNKIKLSYFSPKKDIELFSIKGRCIFSLSYLIKGSYGFPNLFIEKEFGVNATTRNWNTICRMIETKM